MQYSTLTVLLIVVFGALVSGQDPLDQRCLGCICQAISDCNVNAKCDGSTCGLFRITWAYWADAGKPTQPAESPEDANAYANCVNEPYCAARAVQGYMRKFGKDCNGDNLIDCQDYAVLHKLGGYACPGGQISGQYAEKFHQCMTQTG